MMVAEIASVLLFGSMALLADGWHMASHASALGITALSYALSRRHEDNPRFTFGTGKIADLAGYSSALLLALIALLMAYESIQRLIDPVPIRFNEAILVAVLGLMVNLISAVLLREHPEHEHGEADDTLSRRVRAALEEDGVTRVDDLHVWRLGPGHYSAAVSRASQDSLDPDTYKDRLCRIPALSHLTVEVRREPR